MFRFGLNLYNAPIPLEKFAERMINIRSDRLRGIVVRIVAYFSSVIPTCSECGLPDGNHYHLCPNSVHYYSPEQERADDEADNARYDDVRERYYDMIGEE